MRPIATLGIKQPNLFASSLPFDSRKKLNAAYRDRCSIRTNRKPFETVSKVSIQKAFRHE